MTKLGNSRTVEARIVEVKNPDSCNCMHEVEPGRLVASTDNGAQQIRDTGE